MPLFLLLPFTLLIAWYNRLPSSSIHTSPSWVLDSDFLNQVRRLLFWFQLCDNIWCWEVNDLFRKGSYHGWESVWHWDVLNLCMLGVAVIARKLQMELTMMLFSSDLGLSHNCGSIVGSSETVVLKMRFLFLTYFTLYNRL